MKNDFTKIELTKIDQPNTIKNRFQKIVQPNIRTGFRALKNQFHKNPSATHKNTEKSTRRMLKKSTITRQSRRLTSEVGGDEEGSEEGGGGAGLPEVRWQGENRRWQVDNRLRKRERCSMGEEKRGGRFIRAKGITWKIFHPDFSKYLTDQDLFLLCLID